LTQNTFPKNLAFFLSYEFDGGGDYLWYHYDFIRLLKNSSWFDFAHHPELAEGERRNWSVHLQVDPKEISLFSKGFKVKLKSKTLVA
jgi:hypothetical protein